MRLSESYSATTGIKDMTKFVGSVISLVFFFFTVLFCCGDENDAAVGGGSAFISCCCPMSLKLRISLRNVVLLRMAGAKERQDCIVVYKYSLLFILLFLFIFLQ